LRNLSGKLLKLSGVISISLKLEILEDSNWSVDLYILEEACEFEIILGRDFLNKHKLTLICRPVSVDESDRVDLYSALSLCLVEDAETKESSENIIESIKTDFGESANEKVKEIVRSYHNKPVEQIDDGSR